MLGYPNTPQTSKYKTLFPLLKTTIKGSPCHRKAKFFINVVFFPKCGLPIGPGAVFCNGFWLLWCVCVCLGLGLCLRLLHVANVCCSCLCMRFVWGFTLGVWSFTLGVWSCCGCALCCALCSAPSYPVLHPTSGGFFGIAVT